MARNVSQPLWGHGLPLIVILGPVAVILGLDPRISVSTQHARSLRGAIPDTAADAQGVEPEHGGVAAISTTGTAEDSCHAAKTRR